MLAYRIVLYSSENIQGIRLRELIEETANQSEPKIGGHAANLPEKQQVEIICRVENDAQLDGFLESIKKRAKEKVKVSLQNEQPILANDLQKWADFTDFKVIRAGPIEEIDLAIRGAERVFGELQRSILDFIRKRELQKLRGLEYEFLRMKGALKCDEGNKFRLPNRTALDNFLAEPFDSDLGKICEETDQFLDEFKEYQDKKIKDLPAEKTASFLKLIDTALKMIEGQRNSTANKNIN